jgi:hypothetical protein
MSEQKFVENVKQWLKLDNKVKELTITLKEYKEERKDLEEDIIKYMSTTEQDVLNISTGGTLRKSTSKTKGSIKHDYINQILTKFTKSQQEAETITNAILENRPVKERVYLKRNAPRKSNN